MTKPMDKSTKEALLASIKHWEEVVACEKLDDVSISSDKCALCRKFALVRFGCYGCPVYARTGHASCDHTPYVYVKYALDARDPNWRECAVEELNFLKSLL